MDPIYKNSKYTRITLELIKEIESGADFSGDGCFYTRSEITARFGIGMITASKVFSELEERGYIRQCPKKRPRVIRRKQTHHVKNLPVAILVPSEEGAYIPHVSIWYNLTVRRIEQKIIANGYPVSLLPLDKNHGVLKGMYSGAILFDRIEFFPGMDSELADLAVPYVMVTGEGIRPNTVFFEVESFIREVFLKTMKRDIHRVVLASTGRDTIEFFLHYHDGAFFKGIGVNYGYKIKLESIYMDACSEKSVNTELLPYIEELKNKKAQKILFCVSNDFLAFKFYSVLNRAGISPEKYSLIAYTSTVIAPPPCDYIDFKVEEAAEAVTSVLFAQIRSRTQFDPGRVILPECHFTALE